MLLFNQQYTISYEVLSDPDRRSIYDTRGEAGLSEQGGLGNMDPQVSLYFLVTFTPHNHLILPGSL
jgi:DnaJ-class molecular chaperone